MIRVQGLRLARLCLAHKNLSFRPLTATFDRPTASLVWQNTRPFSSTPKDPETPGEAETIKDAETSDKVSEDSTIPIAPVVEEVSESHSFKAETEKLLDIVTNSIYADKDVFMRELISNASDALEKARFESSPSELKVDISTSDDNILEVSDTGIGMTKEEMMNNLGTIAKSGSKEFVSKLESGAAGGNIIGQFGVGFYSAFMVAQKIEVISKRLGAKEAYKWTSTGTGKYDITQTTDLKPGVESYSVLKLHLKDDCKEFGTANKIKDIIKSYSKFVAYPVFVDGDKVNTVEAIWMQQRQNVTQEQYTEFYKYLSNGFDEPLFVTHFHADAPINVKCLLFAPSFNMENSPIAGRTKKGVSLYSRKVLIEANSERILPNWLRFVKGVVDSEDLPLSLSRETVQNSRLVANLQELVVKKFLRELKGFNKDDYNTKFWPDFGSYLMEGLCSDGIKFKEQLAPLLRFKSSQEDLETVISLDDYMSRMKPDQKKIYYLNVGSKVEHAKESPYLEAFKEDNTEVLLITNPLEEFTLNALQKHNEYEFVSVSSDKELGKSGAEVDTEKFADLTKFFKDCLDTKVQSVDVSTRLRSSPAIVVDPENMSQRIMFKRIMGNKEASPKSVEKLEINIEHPIIAKINEIHKDDKELAEQLVGHVFDTAMLGSGIAEDAREMLPRMNKLLERLLSKVNK